MSDAALRMYELGIGIIAAVIVIAVFVVVIWIGQVYRMYCRSAYVRSLMKRVNDKSLSQEERHNVSLELWYVLNGKRRDG